ncbi:DUF7261 family protein [Haloarcula sp. GH36]|uniref:DUF7261 family protein n=1 Tax=Haloarcula montana TaxID=3111776 RepID=UPI002D77DC1B|nr:hypothetical protein [Haloarcula sp. GH36]
MSERGQLVLVAAVLVAIAIALLVLAALQLGYHGDVHATADDDDPTAATLRVLERSVPAASRGIPRDYSWSRRSAAVSAVRGTLTPTLDRLRTAGIREGVIRNVSYNETAATAWQRSNCPSGPNRAFGPCRTNRGVAVQERAGRTHVLAVGFDVTVTTQRGRTAVTVVVPVAS